MGGHEELSIDSDGIAALGTRLGEIAGYLEEKAAHSNRAGVQTYGFPSSVGSSAYSDVVGDYELLRTAVCAQLRELRDLARTAGSWYVATEQMIDPRHRGTM